MKSLPTRLLLFAAALFICLTGAAAATPTPADADAPQVVVAPVSYLAPTDLLHVLRHQAIREALVFSLRRAGYAVASEGRALATEPSFLYLPPAGFRAAYPDATLVLLTSGIDAPGDLRVSVEGPALDKGLTLPAGLIAIPDVLPTASALVDGLRQAGLPGKSAAPPPRPGKPLDPRDLADAARLNWTTLQRLDKIAEGLQSVQSGRADAAAVERLAIDCALHAAYLCRTDEVQCARWFGKAQVFAELAVASVTPAHDPSVVQVCEEIGRLAERFGAGRRAEALDRPPRLAETAVLEHLERLPFEEAKSYPRIGSLFDFLVHRECRLFTRGYHEVIDSFAKADDAPKTDCALIWTKEDNFDGNMFLSNSVGSYRLAELLSSPLLRPAMPAMRKSLAAYQDDPASLLETAGLHARGGALLDNNYTQTALLFLVLARTCSQAADDPDTVAFSSSVALGYPDVYAEIRNDFVQTARGIRNRVRGLGWGQTLANIDVLFKQWSEQCVQVGVGYDVPMAYREDMICDWRRFLTFWHRRAAEPGQSPLKRLLTRVPPALQTAVAAYHDGDPVPADLRAQVVATLNALLRERDLYSPALYFRSDLSDSARRDLTAANATLSAKRLAEINRALIGNAFDGLISDQTYDAPLPIDADLEMSERFAQASQAFWAADFTRAADGMARLAPWLERASNAWNVYYESLCRTGRAEEALAQLAAVNSHDFALDDTRYKILQWRQRDFSGLPSLWRAATLSADDYLTRAEHAFRVGDLGTMDEALTSYHYEAGADVLRLRALCAVLREGRDDPGAWKNFEAYLSTSLQGRYDWATAYLPHWLALLDERLGDQPQWRAAKEHLNLTGWGKVMQCDLTMRGCPDVAALRDAYAASASVTRAEVARGTAGGSLGRALLDTATDMQHQALGRLLAAALKDPRSGSFTDAELVAAVRDAAAASRQWNNLSNHPVPVVPTEAYFLYEALAFGADAKALAEWCARLPADVTTAVFERGDPLFMTLAHQPATLQALLEMTRARPEMYKLSSWNVASIQPLDCRELFSDAVRSREDQAATALAVRIVRDEQDFKPLASLLADDAKGRAWIARNAPGKALEKRWLEELAAAQKTKPEPASASSSVAPADLFEQVVLR